MRTSPLETSRRHSRRKPVVPAVILASTLILGLAGEAAAAPGGGKGKPSQQADADTATAESTSSESGKTDAELEAAAYDRYADAYGSEHWNLGLDGPVTSLSVLNRTITTDALHDHGFDGTGIGVALIDTGVAPVPGLDDERIVHGPDLSFDSQVPGMIHLDGYGHGTHLAGIIASDLPGHHGTAPDATLVSVKAGAFDGAVDVTQVIAGIDWVVEHKDDPGLNIRVLALSYGTDSTQDPMIDPLSFAVERAWKAGITVVVAAGNDGFGAQVASPATNPWVITVGGSTTAGTSDFKDDGTASFNSTGTDRHIDVLAPGVSIASLRSPGSWIDESHPDAIVDETFLRGSGSSQAAAAAAGAIASLLEAHPELQPGNIKEMLLSSGRPIRKAGPGQGEGLINMASVMSKADSGAWDDTQSLPASTGLGSIDAARGTDRLELDGVELAGEIDIFGEAWDAQAWTDAASFDGTWIGGDWLGRSWTGSDWNGRSWTGRSWTGRSWTGRSWTDYGWTEADWSGRSWTGRSWTGRSWTGRSWTGRSWTGRSWT